MKILGIETSCDETAASVVQNGTQILSNAIVSQIDIHKAYGGVVPEIAARSHIEAILPVIDQSLKDAQLDWNQIDAIAVTHTPGLLGSLLIGTLTARTLALLHDKPLYPTHHLKSHIYANWLDNSGKKESDAEISNFKEYSVSPVKKSDYPSSENLSERSELFSELDDKKTFLQTRANGDSEKLLISELPSFPLISLVISGGHTQLIHMTSHNHFEIIGTTKDDAIGEVFDKIAKILGLPYPGGPSIAAAATKGNPKKYKLPHPKMPDYDFSFSGLKTAVLRAIQKELNLPISTPSSELAAKLTPQQIADFAASFQSTTIDILIDKLETATKNYQPRSILLAGGVAANQNLREAVTEKFGASNFEEYSVSPVKKSDYPSSENLSERSELFSELDDKKTFLQTRANGRSEKLLAPNLFFPSPALSTDNAAMVAAAAFFAREAGQQPIDPYELDISPRSQIA